MKKWTVRALVLIHLVLFSAASFAEASTVVSDLLASAHELVIIDESVADKQVFYQNLKPGAVIHEVDSHNNGLEQLHRIVNKYEKIDALHIISHGQSGEIQLGNSSLTKHSLQNKREQLREINEKLIPGADILFYGCNVASGEKGEAFLSFISQELDADIAASTNLSGASIKKGDWNFELTLGSIESNIAFHSEGLNTYSHVLQTSFAGLGASDSGGSGFKSLTDTNLVVSNDFSDSGTEIYFNDAVSTSRTLTIQTDGVDAATVDVSALTLYSFVGSGIDLDASSTVVFRGTSGSAIQTMTLNANKELTSSDTDIFSFFDNNTTSPVTGVAQIDFVIALSACCANGNNFSNLTFKNITYTNAVAPSPAPTITSATYDSSNNTLVVTGLNFQANGSGSDVDVSDLTITGQASGTRALTTSSDVEIDSSTQFTVTLTGSDIAAVEALLNNNGTTSLDVTTYNLSAADDFITNITAGDISDTTGNGITVSRVPDADGDLTFAAGVSEPIGLDTTIDTSGEALNIFDFTLSDGGSSDGVAMTISQVVVNVSGTTTDTQRGNIIWRLNGADASNVVGSYNSSSDTITFSSLNISIADNTIEVYTVNAYFSDNSGVTEDATFILSIDGDTDITVGAGGTQMGATNAVRNSTGGTLDVVASAIAFTTQPAGSVSGSALSTQPVITAQDAAGNIDVDFTETITLTEASAGTLSGSSVAAIAGLATFTSLTYNASADQQSFTLTANDQDGVGSDISTTSANALTSDVIATQLVFSTQPASSISGQVLSTQPVVSARDAQGVDDTGFTETLTLTEASAGSLSGASVAAVSGVATFTSVNYTATADQQSFTLTVDDQAGIGTDLGSTDANAVTSDVVATNLVFTTQPAPLTTTSGLATNFTTVPVVVAQDANGTADTGYSTGIVISEVNGAGSALLSGTGDSDGDASTVTLSPASGAASYTGMQITYTTSGASNENFNLRASSGGLTAANSSQLSAIFPDSDASLSAGSGVSEPIAIDSSIDTAGESINIFDFVISDGGTADAIATEVSTIRINTSGTLDPSQVTFRISGNDANNLSGSYNSNVITFSGLAISVADGGSETYTVNAYFNDNTGLVEDQTLLLSIDGDTDLTLSNTGTQMGATSALTNGAGSSVNVVATSIAFTTQPAGSVSGSPLSTQPIVSARDAFGNTDIDFTETVTLTEASAGVLSGTNSVAAVSGVATFTGLTYTATLDQQSVTLTADDQAGVGSDLASVNANAISSDVVATQLLFDTQPAALNVYSGQAYSLTTVPVVSARDANNIVDTGFSAGITIAEINGAGTAIITSTSDTDGNSADASTTLSPSSGQVTATGLQVTYTNTGATESFNLQASATGLSSASSSQFTSLLSDADANLTSAAGVTEPLAISYSVDTVGEAINLFDFTLTDGAGGDNLALDISELRISVTGTATDTDRSNITWRLNGADASNVTGAYNSISDTIVFSGLSLSIADGASEIYTVNAYFNDNSNLNHGATIILSIDGDTDLSVGSTGTQMGATSAITNGAGTIITDDLGPSISAVTLPTNGTYIAGTDLNFTVDFTENITVNTSNGTPRLSLTIGSSTQYANYVSGSSSSALLFSYSIQEGDNDSDGINLATTLDTNLGTLQDAQGNTASTNLGALASLAAVLVDTQAPNIEETSAVNPIANDSTPNVSFSSDEAGNLAVGGSCGSASEGAISSGTQTIVLTQADNSSALADGSYSDCSLTVTDAAGNSSDIVTLTSFIVDINAPTILANTGQTLDEGSEVTVTSVELSATDNYSAADAVTYTLVSAPTNGTLSNNGSNLASAATFTQEDINNNRITYSHIGDETSSDSFSFVLSDGLENINNNSASNFTYSLTVNGINDAPSAENDTAVTNEDNAIMVDILDNDTDSDDGINAASVSIVSAALNGTTSINTGTGVITYTPADNFEGDDSFSYSVEDVSGTVSNTATVAVSVIAQNDAPIAAADLVNTNVNNAIIIDLTANDSDIDNGDSLDVASLVIVSDPSNGTAVIDAGQIEYTPETDFAGSDSFTYTIDDTVGATSNTATVTINVITPNELPDALADSANTAEDTAVNINVLNNDSDTDGFIIATTVAIMATPSNGTTSINTTTGTINYTPAENFNGTDTFSYTVQDDAGGTSNAALVTVTVNAVNDAPILENDVVTLIEDNSLNINVLGNDSDVDGMINLSSVTIVTAPVQGDVRVNTATGVVTYTPDENYSGGDSFSYRAADNLGAISNIASVTLSVNAVNDAPLANDDSAQVLSEQDLRIDLLNNDVEVDGSLEVNSLTIVTAPTVGTLVNNNDGTVTYTPTITESGSDTFTYTVEDNVGALSNTATVNIIITRPTPVIIDNSTAPPANVDEGETYSFTPDATVFEGLSPSFTIQNAPSWLNFNNTNGSLSGIPSVGDIGRTDNIVITVDDGYSTASITAFSITVAPGEDTDGDNVSDYQEGLDQTDASDATDYFDLTAPELQVPDDIILDATGLFTAVSLAELLGLEADAAQEDIQSQLDIIATDNVEGAACCNPLVTSMNGGQLLLAPGLQQVTWQAVDFRGNTNEQTQTVRIRPLVSFGKDKTTAEDNVVNIKVLLNGQAPRYPLTIPYLIDITASTTDNTEVDGVIMSNDHDLSDGVITFNEGETEASITVNVPPDGIAEADEELVLIFDDRSADSAIIVEDNIYDVNSGAKNTFTLRIVERNIAPQVTLQAQQAGANTVQIAQSDGTVIVSSRVDDENIDDTATLDWSLTDNRLIDTDDSDSTFSFDPTGLEEGLYRVKLRVTDSGGAMASASRSLVIVSSLPELERSVDSDGDGIDDVTEGATDSDEDGIPNYLDNISLANVVPEDTSQSDSFLIECEPGIRCLLGQFALFAESGGARLSDDDIDEQDGIIADEEFEPVGGIFDFEMHELEIPGQQVRIVLPQISAIPTDAVYRKFLNGQWQDYVVNERNLIHSSEGSLGFCPPPGDPSWQAGLISGFFCVQLTIEDGGPNDADGEVNAAISDPGAVSTAIVPNISVSTRGSSGGGAIGFGMIAVLVMLLLGSRRATIKVIHRCLPFALFSMLILPPQHSQAETKNDFILSQVVEKSFIELDVYSFNGNQSQDRFEREMTRSNVPVEVSDYDVSRTGYQLAWGYTINPYATILLAYSDLGNVTTGFNAAISEENVLAEALKKAHPLTANGWTIAYRYRHQLPWNKTLSKFHLFTDIGLFFWDADIDTNLPNTNATPGSVSGSDWSYSIGGDYSITEKIQVNIKYRYHKLAEQSLDGLGLGFRVAL